MIEGSTIRLRAWREDDLPIMTDLRNDIALQAQLLARVRGSDTSQVRDWLQSRSSNSDSQLFIVAGQQDDQAIGFAQITGIDPVDRRGELGICLIRHEHRKGIGSEVITLLLPYLRNNWNLHKLSLRVRADNLGAIACYKKIGFEQCGYLREHAYIDDNWRDVVLMELFLERPSLECA